MTARAYDPVGYLEASARERGDATAVWDAGRQLTFRELYSAVGRLQWLLAAQGVQAGDVVGVRLANVWEYVALELAIPAMGAVVLPLPLGLGEHEMRWVIAKTNPRLVIDHPPVLASTPAPAPAHPAGLDPDRTVEIALTSGTTGMPKLASLSARLKQATFEGFTGRLGITPGDRVLPMTPLTQGIGGMCLYCLRSGAALVMLREPRWTPARCADVARESRATVMVGVPTNVIRMLNDPQPLPDSLRAVAVAGAPLPPEIAERWEASTGIPISSFYGSMDAGQLAVASPTDPREKRWTTVGRPHDQAEWKIVDGPAGRPVTAGQIGEICMRGRLVQDRYWGESSGPYAADGWAHMGDLGFVDAEGYLHVVGRVKDIIIRGGTNINPYEVESMLRSHPGVFDACVVGRPDPDLGEVPVAFVVPRNGVTLGQAPGQAELESFLAERGLAHYKWPVSVQAIDELPLSGPGKVDRKSLRDHARAL